MTRRPTTDAEIDAAINEYQDRAYTPGDEAAETTRAENRFEQWLAGEKEPPRSEPVGAYMTRREAIDWERQKRLRKIRAWNERGRSA